VSVPKYTPERIEAILAALRTGQTRRAAAACADIGPTTFYRWLDEDDGTLRDAVEKAEAEAEAFYLRAVQTAAADPKTWTAAAWWLERRKYADYGRKDKVEMTIDLRKEAERIAAEQGLDPDEVLREAEAIMAGKR
jgi:hypothetical protein